MATFTSLAVGQGRRLYASAACQSALGTAATITHCLKHALDWPPFNADLDAVLDDEFSGGLLTDFPSRSLPVMAKFGTSISIWAGIESIPMFLAKAVGVDTKTGGSSPYKHAIAPDALPDYLPIFTLQEHMGGSVYDAGRDVKALDLSVDSFELSWGGSGFAVLTLGLIGTGRVEAGSDITESGLTIPSKFLVHSQFRTSFRAATARGQSSWDGTHSVSATAGTFPTIDASNTDLSAWLTGGKLRWSNNASESERSGGSSVDAGYYGGLAMAGKRTCEMELDIRLDNTSEGWIKAFSGHSWTTQNEYLLQLDMVGHTNGHGGQIVLPLAALLENPSGRSGSGPQVMTCRFGARKTTVGTDRAVLSSEFLNQDNYDYA